MSFARALNVFDLERMAKRRLPAGVFGFIGGGAQDDRTRDNNRAAFDRVRFKPRGLVDIAGRGQDVTVFGHRFDSPFGIAPPASWRGRRLPVSRRCLSPSTCLSARTARTTCAPASRCRCNCHRG